MGARARDYLPGYRRLAGWYVRRRQAIPRFLRAYARNRPHARVVEIGANDGTRIDPLRDAMRRASWSGVMVEPHPVAFAALAENIREFDGRIVAANVAVDNVGGVRKLHYIDQEDAQDLPWWSDTIASFHRDHLLAHGDAIPNVEARIRSLDVETITFESLCQRYHLPSVDVVMTDVEGHDHVLLADIDFDRHGVSLVLFEHMHMSAPNWRRTVQSLEAQGFDCLSEGYDTLGYRVGDDPALSDLWRRLTPAVPTTTR